MGAPQAAGWVELMEKCRAADPQVRPSFTGVRVAMENIGVGAVQLDVTMASELWYHEDAALPGKRARRVPRW